MILISTYAILCFDLLLCSSCSNCNTNGAYTSVTNSSPALSPPPAHPIKSAASTYSQPSPYQGARLPYSQPSPYEGARPTPSPYEGDYSCPTLHSHYQPPVDNFHATIDLETHTIYRRFTHLQHDFRGSSAPTRVHFNHPTEGPDKLHAPSTKLRLPTKFRTPVSNCLKSYPCSTTMSTTSSPSSSSPTPVGGTVAVLPTPTVPP